MIWVTRIYRLLQNTTDLWSIHTDAWTNYTTDSKTGREASAGFSKPVSWHVWKCRLNFNTHHWGAVSFLRMSSWWNCLSCFLHTNESIKRVKGLLFCPFDCDTKQFCRCLIILENYQLLSIIHLSAVIIRLPPHDSFYTKKFVGIRWQGDKPTTV